MIDLFAVKPNLGTVVHLSSPGYEPGKKHRSIRDHCSLCNCGIGRQERVPLAEALQWPNPAPAALLQPARDWSWWRSCVGHAAAIVGLCADVLALVQAKAAGS